MLLVKQEEKTEINILFEYLIALRQVKKKTKYYNEDDRDLR